MIGLTPRQSECLKFLKFYIREHGVAPSLSECAFVLHCSQSNVSRLWVRLEERGHIRRLGTNGGGLEILSDEYLGFLTSDVRSTVIEYAKVNNMLPETVIAIRMREWAEHEARSVA